MKMSRMEGASKTAPRGVNYDKLKLLGSFHKGGAAAWILKGWKKQMTLNAVFNVSQLKRCAQREALV